MNAGNKFQTNSVKKSCQNLHITSFDGFLFIWRHTYFSAALHDIWSGTGPKFPGLHDCQCDQCHGFQSGTHLVSGMYSTNPFDQWFASRKSCIGCTFIFQSLIFSISIFNYDLVGSFKMWIETDCLQFNAWVFWRILFFPLHMRNTKTKY